MKERGKMSGQLNNACISILCFISLAMSGVTAAAEDINPPVLHSVSVSPSVVDAGGEVTVTIEATDSPAGLNAYSSNAILYNPSRTMYTYACKFSHVSGNIYSATAMLTKFAEGGIWTVESVKLIDNAHNIKYYQNGVDYNATFKVVPETPDIVPPVLHSVSVSPSLVKAGEEVTVTINATDSPAGFNAYSSSATLYNPSRTMYIYADKFSHVSGNIYSATATIPELAESGTWTVESVKLVDNAHNIKYYQNGIDYNATFKVKALGR